MMSQREMLDMFATAGGKQRKLNTATQQGGIHLQKKLLNIANAQVQYML